MIAQIITAILSILTTSAGAAYMVRLWTAANKNGAEVIDKYSTLNKRFFSTFLGLYRYLTVKQKRKFPKFILYYLASKGLLSFKIEADGTVLLMRTSDVDPESVTEQFLMDAIFQDTEEYFLSEDAIMGLEAVRLNDIRSRFANGMLSCPLGYDIKENTPATLGNPGKNITLDKDRMKKDTRSMLLVSIASTFMAVLPLSLAIADYPIDESLIASYFIWALFLVPLFCALSGLIKYSIGERKEWFPQETKQFRAVVSTLRLIADGLVITCFGFAALIFMCFTFSESAGLSIIAALFALAANIGLWIHTVKRRRNKVKHYVTAENDLLEFVSFIKRKLRSLRKKRKIKLTDMDRYSEYLRGTTGELIPYASLFGKQKDINALLLEEKTKMPNWIDTANEMTFEEADAVIDNDLMRNANNNNQNQTLTR